MKLISRFELANKSEMELHSLLRETFNALSMTEPNSYQRRNTLASIETIQNELSSRAYH